MERLCPRRNDDRRGLHFLGLFIAVFLRLSVRCQPLEHQAPVDLLTESDG